MDSPGLANPSEKRKVGGSTPPLTTIMTALVHPADLRKVASGRQQPRSGIDLCYPSLTVIRRSLVHVEFTKLNHQLGRPGEGMAADLG
jgi:hypothetical protein